MPDLWKKKEPVDLDKPKEVHVKKPRVNAELPDFLKEKIGVPVKTASKQPASALKKAVPAYKMNIRTVSPSLKTTLTYKDVEAFIATMDVLKKWADNDNYKKYSVLIGGDALLNAWETEQGTALSQNGLKDVVNPCQRIVLKTRFSGLYDEFAGLVAQEGFTPEEWAYTCDRTIKAYRVADASLDLGYAIKFHRKGYFDHYIEKLPRRWKNEMYAVEEAIIKMYETTPEDVNAVKPYKEEILKEIIKNRGVFLTCPIVY